MTEKIEGLSIGLGLDTISVETGLTDLRSKMRLVNSEMKANLSAFDRGDKSLEKYQTTLSGLNKKLEVQKAITDKAKSSYEKMIKEHGEGSKEAEKAAREYNNQVAALNGLDRAVQRTTNELNEMQEEQKKSSSGWTKLSNNLERIGGKLTSVGKGMSMGITAPLTALAFTANRSFYEIEEGLDNVIKATGATGKTLESLQKSFEKVYGKFPVESDVLGDVLGEVNTRFAFMDEQLEESTEKFLKFADITGVDAKKGVQLVARAMGDAGVDAKDYAKVLDIVAASAQITGVSADNLLESITKYGAPMRALGFEMSESVALFASWEKAGVNAEIAMSGLKQSISRWGKEGKDPREEFKKTLKEIQKAPNIAKATSKAIEAFGAKAGPDLADAIQGGRFEFEELLKSLEGSEGIVDQAFDSTQKGSQKFKVAMQNAKLVGADLWRLVEGSLAPTLENLVGKLQKGTEWFGSLSDKSKRTILMVGGFAAALGPVITGLGFAVTGVSALIGGLGLLGSPVGLTVLALGGLAAGYVALDKAMDKPIIKSDIFAGEISDATEKAVGSYMKLDSDATAELDSLAFSQATITQEMADDMVTKYQQMGDKVLTAMKENHGKQLDELQSLFDRSAVLTEEEEAKRIAKLKADQLKEIEAHNENQARIKEIWMTAAHEKRGITDSEAKELAKLQEQSRIKAVEELSASQQEQETILRNLKNNKEIIEAETAANTVRKSVETRDKVVKEANQQYNETVGWATEARDNLGIISAKEADDIIREAERKKNESTSKASDMHDEVLRQAQLQAGEHVSEVNWETGQVLSGWDSMYNGVISAVNWIRGLFGKSSLSKRGTVKENGRQRLKRQNARLEAYALGTPSTGHPGGPAIVGEEGMELAHIPGYGVTLLGTKGPQFIGNLPRGSSVLPNKHTESMLKSYGFPGYKEGIGDYFDVFLKGAGNVWSLMKDKFKLKDSLLPSWLNNHTGSPLSMIGEMATSMIKNLWDGWFGSLGSSSNGYVRNWIAKAVALTGVPSSWIGPLSTIAMKESGGNPKAINLWDINAKSGIPSKGLMQTIGPTFNAHKMPGMDDIWNPVHNAAASIRYILSRYGSVFNVPGIKSMISGGAYRGYATGGRVGDGLYRLGEEGWPEWIIPTDPARRTDAMKLLALAGREITGNKRPHQMPSVNGSDDSIMVKLLDATLQQNQILMKILQKNPSANIDGWDLTKFLWPHMKEYNKIDRAF